MISITNHRRAIYSLIIMTLASLSCRNPFYSGPLDEIIPDSGEHISDDQLQSDIQTTREEYFDENFNGDHVYNSPTSQTIPPECNFEFPRGREVKFNQLFIPGEEQFSDQVVITTASERTFYTNRTPEQPYEFCRDVNGLDNDSNPVVYRECITYTNLGFNMHVEYFDRDRQKTRVCHSESYIRNDATSSEQVSFDGSWDSGPVCAELSETTYRWQVSLIQSEMEVSGTLRFHDCPGGGQVAYQVTGTVIPGDDYILLQGVKSGGAGKLFDSTPNTQEFRLFPNQPPEPNFGQ